MANIGEVTVKVKAEVEAKPGYKTTEFWLSTAASVVAMIVAAGIVETGGTWDKAIALVVMALSSMGYRASRANVKRAVRK